MRGTRKAQMDLWNNHKPGDKESPSKLGPLPRIYGTTISRAIRNPPASCCPCRGLWNKHKPGDKESPQQAGPPAEDLWNNHKPGDKESPQQAGFPLPRIYGKTISRAIRNPQQAKRPPAEDLWKNHKPGDKESPSKLDSFTAGNTSLSFTPNAQASRL